MYMKNVWRLLTLIILSLRLNACHEVNIQPQEPKFYTRDITLFWEVFDGATNLSPEYFQQAYIDQGTPGLRDYAEQKDLAAALPIVLNSEAYRDYYLSVRENTLDVSDAVERSKQAFKKLRDIYSGTQFYNVYFLVGAMGAGGRISNNGLLVAVEMFSRKVDTPTERLRDWHQNVTRNKRYLPSIVVHEFIHIQQRFSPSNQGYRTTLEQAIHEGMADFVSKYLLDGEPFMNEHLHTYGDARQSALWEQFEDEMNQDYQDTEWFYTGRKTSLGHPADMGYYMGYKILESYAATFDTIDQAIAAMLSESDYQTIYEQSTYASQFE
jgi:hypothetical protein